jgi:hypothetical protein
LRGHLCYSGLTKPKTRLPKARYKLEISATVFKSPVLGESPPAGKVDGSEKNSDVDVVEGKMVVRSGKEEVVLVSLGPTVTWLNDEGRGVMVVGRGEEGDDDVVVGKVSEGSGCPAFAQFSRKARRRNQQQCSIKQR